MSAVMLLTALDTRGEEAFYLKGRLEALGCKVILVDMAMRAHSREGADYTCVEVARSGGADFHEISTSKGTATITGPMMAGCIGIAGKLYKEKAIDAGCRFRRGDQYAFYLLRNKGLPSASPTHPLQLRRHARLRGPLLRI